MVKQLIRKSLSVLVIVGLLTACDLDKKDGASEAVKRGSAEVQKQAQQAKQAQVEEQVFQYDYFIELRRLTVKRGIKDNITRYSQSIPGAASVVPVIHRFGKATNSDAEKNLELAFPLAQQQYWSVIRGTALEAKAHDIKQIEIPGEYISNNGEVSVTFSLLKDGAVYSHSGTLSERHASNDFTNLVQNVNFTLNLMDETLYQVSDVSGEINTHNVFLYTVDNDDLKAEFAIIRRLE